MNILLINPPCRLPTNIPLGLGYIASIMRKKGHDVKLLDINAFGYSDAQVEQNIKASDFDIAGIGGLSSTYKYVKWLSKALKAHNPGGIVVAGNMVATASAELLLNNSEIDIAAIGEGEITFQSIVSAVNNKSGFDKVRGIAYKQGHDIIRQPAQERIKDLDSLPFPAWDLFPMETYLNNSTQSPESFGMRQINVSSERGCPYNCIFCSQPFGRTVYTRSADSIISEINELKARYKVQFINFSDDLFLLKKERVLDFCDKAISQNLNIKWSASGRVNLVDSALLSTMRKAGCAELSYGIESGNQAILDNLKKGVSVKQAEEAIKMTRKAGISVLGSLIFGIPGETKDSIKQTLAFMKRAELPTYRFFYATPYPDTELYAIAKKLNRLPEDEDKYLDSLGEMHTTFIVNLTDFSDKEFVRLKEATELKAKRNLSLKVKLKEFTENWQRRYFISARSIKERGVAETFRVIFFKIIKKSKLLLNPGK